MRQSVMWLDITLSISFDSRVRLDIGMQLLSNPVSRLDFLSLADIIACVFVCVCECVGMSVYVYVCVHVCMRVYVLLHICITNYLHKKGHNTLGYICICSLVIQRRNSHSYSKNCMIYLYLSKLAYLNWIYVFLYTRLAFNDNHYLLVGVRLVVLKRS